MAQILAEDSIDWSAYERSTDTSAKVRPASEFLDSMVQLFVRRAPGMESCMFSTKLRNMIEFRAGELTCWTGYSGHRKSTFLGQVALDLCVQNERVLIASMEMSPANTIARMLRQAAGCGHPQASYCVIFGRWTDGRLWLFDHIGRVSPTRMIAVCNYFAQELTGRHVVIDSMMMVCASEESLDEQKQFVTDLVRTAQETGLHIHLVTHCRKPQSGLEDKPPGKYDLRGSAAISDQAANVITVWDNRTKKAKLTKDPNDLDALEQADAAVTVEKQRNGSWEGRIKLWWDDRSMRFLDERTGPVTPYAFLSEGEQMREPGEEG